MNREPVLKAGVAGTVVAAILTLLTSFGLDITDDQQSAVLGFVAVVFPLVVALFVRPSVTPVNDPQTNDGTPLVPADGGDPELEIPPAGQPYIP